MASVNVEPKKSSSKIPTVQELSIESIYPYLQEFKSVWDPLSGGKEEYPMKTYLENKGIRVIDTDKQQSPEYDFLQYKTKKRFDAIITISAGGAKKDFINRAVEIGKPFAVYMPLSNLESKTMRETLQKCKTSGKCKQVSLLFPKTTYGSDAKKSASYYIWLLCNFENVPSLVL